MGNVKQSPVDFFYLAAVDKHVAAVVGGGAAAAVGSVELRMGQHLRGSGVPRYPRSKGATFDYFDILFPLLEIKRIKHKDSLCIYFV